ncbi:VgrG-related protein [Nonomuraea sediminis]|uniref:VgrG-related protein n=1 Tax=Nonomuraea sediminis TaxID=2835864 RepID=UPI001BDD39B4|nr:VgrG-related protein [Nonomuraea sediminis]
MAAELFTGGLMVDVEGNPLPEDVAIRLVSGYVEDSGHLPDMFVLRFRDDANVALSKGGFAIGAKVRLKVQTSDPGGPRLLMNGEVTSVALDVTPDGTYAEVRGMDEAHRLMRGRRVAVYPDMTVADIVRKVARRAGLQPGEIDPLPGVGGRPGTQINQDGISDWEFLCRLARRTGARVRVTDGKLSFRLPRPPAGPAVSVEAGGALLSLRATVTAGGQVPEVEVRGWDFENKQEVAAMATPRAAEAEVPGADPVALGKRFGAPSLTAGESTYRTQADVAAAAGALAAELGGSAAELEGVVRGDPVLRAGTVVALTNVGAPFEGKYTLSTTRHAFSGVTGYTTAFTVSAGCPPCPAPPGGLGLVPAIVSDVHDPAGQGRLRLSMPWLAAGYTSGWARVITAGAGSDRGAVLPAEVGDEVLVGFENGDFDHPYVLGGLYNGQDAPPGLSTPMIDDVSGQVNVRALVSRTGHRLELVDSVTGGSGVLLASGDERLTVRLDARTGMLAIKGANGVTIDAGMGQLELKGARVTMTGQADVEIRGTQVRIN